MQVTLTFLGTGTSVGVPMVGCDCPICSSPDPRDNRYRSSVMLQWNENTVVIDATPEFRLQMLREKVQCVNGVVFTHHHADHIHGLDDIRPFCFLQDQSIPLYGPPDIMDYIEHHYDYIWNAPQPGGGLPRVTIERVVGSFEILGLPLTPVPILHGKVPIYGYRIGDCAYLTDCSEIPDASLPLLQGLKTLILDAVRYRPHTTHLHVEKSIALAQSIGAAQTWLTHMNHEILHAQLAEECPPGIGPAWDGLKVAIAV